MATLGFSHTWKRGSAIDYKAPGQLLASGCRIEVHCLTIMEQNGRV